jgi:excinuclease UvrABC ATPase subunit
MLDMSKSLNEGAIVVPMFGKLAYNASGFFGNDKKLSDYISEEMDLLLHGKNRKFKIKNGGTPINVTYLGVIEKFAQSYIQRDFKALSERTRIAVEPYIAMGPCQLCQGTRLSQAALNCKINGHNISELSSMEMSELIAS